MARRESSTLGNELLRFEDWSPEFGWWLEKRIRTLQGFATPTGVVTRQP